MSKERRKEKGWKTGKVYSKELGQSHYVNVLLLTEDI